MGQPISLIEYALTSIRTNIQNGVYPPGHKLTTQNISDELNISRTPVIAAINRLVSEGLAESIPRKGTIVTQLTPKRIKDMCEARYMIEMHVIAPAIERIDSSSGILKKMQALARDFNEIQFDDFDYETVSSLDQEFHTLYVSLADNGQIVKMYQGNWSIGTPYYILRRAKVPLSSINDQLGAHQEFVELLAEKNEEGLKKSLSKHLIAIQNIVMDILKENPRLLEGTL